MIDLNSSTCVDSSGKGLKVTSIHLDEKKSRTPGLKDSYKIDIHPLISLLERKQ